MKHTQGKWTVRPFKHQIFIDSDNHYIADMFKEHQSREEQLANANLIAAAPELLKACKSMKIHFKYAIDDDADREVYYKLLEAIAKAEDN